MKYILVLVITVIITITAFTAIIMCLHIVFGTIISSSMEPTMPVGTFYIALPSNNYSIGDIIVYRHDNMTIAHRIVRILIPNKCYITKGDNNEYEDPWSVCNPDILGKIILYIPYGRYMFISLFIVLSTVFIFSYRKLFNHTR